MTPLVSFCYCYDGVSFKYVAPKVPAAGTFSATIALRVMFGVCEYTPFLGR